jgi:hypothetical protein
VHRERGACGVGVGLFVGGARLMLADPSVAKVLQRTLEREPVDAADPPDLAQRVIVQAIGRHQPTDLLVDFRIRRSHQVAVL